MAFSPVNVLLTAELTGGDDVDEYYCPEIEWNWDDGGKSVHEADCAPLESGGTFERRYTAIARVPAGRHLQRQGHHAEGQPPGRGGHGDGDGAPGRRRLSPSGTDP